MSIPSPPQFDRSAIAPSAISSAIILYWSTPITANPISSYMIYSPTDLNSPYAINNVPIPISSYTISSLTNGQDYLYSIYNIDTSEQSSLSVFYRNTEPGLRPNAPINITVSTINQRSTFVFWKAASTNDPSQLQGYVINTGPQNLYVNPAGYPVGKSVYPNEISSIITTLNGEQSTLTVQAVTYAGYSSKAWGSYIVPDYSLRIDPYMYTSNNSTITDCTSTFTYSTIGFGGNITQGDSGIVGSNMCLNFNSSDSLQGSQLVVPRNMSSFTIQTWVKPQLVSTISSFQNGYIIGDCNNTNFLNIPYSFAGITVANGPPVNPTRLNTGGNNNIFNIGGGGGGGYGSGGNGGANTYTAAGGGGGGCFTNGGTITFPTAGTTQNGAGGAGGQPGKGGSILFNWLNSSGTQIGTTGTLTSPTIPFDTLTNFSIPQNTAIISTVITGGGGGGGAGASGNIFSCGGSGAIISQNFNYSGGSVKVSIGSPGTYIAAGKIGSGGYSSYIQYNGNYNIIAGGGGGGGSASTIGGHANTAGQSGYTSNTNESTIVTPCGGGGGNSGGYGNGGYGGPSFKMELYKGLNGNNSYTQIPPQQYLRIPLNVQPPSVNLVANTGGGGGGGGYGSGGCGSTGNSSTPFYTSGGGGGGGGNYTNEGIISYNTVAEDGSYTLTCYDAYNNILTAGGDNLINTVPGNYIVTIPQGTIRINAIIIGGCGGKSSSSISFNGGYGAKISQTILYYGGTINIVVGSKGANMSGSGNGGSASSLQYNNRYIIIAGGGGGGGNIATSTGGNGGCTAVSSVNFTGAIILPSGGGRGNLFGIGDGGIGGVIGKGSSTTNNRPGTPGSSSSFITIPINSIGPQLYSCPSDPQNTKVNNSFGGGYGSGGGNTTNLGTSGGGGNYTNGGTIMYSDSSGDGTGTEYIISFNPVPYLGGYTLTCYNSKGENITEGGNNLTKNTAGEYTVTVPLGTLTIVAEVTGSAGYNYPISSGYGAKITQIFQYYGGTITMLVSNKGTANTTGGGYSSLTYNNKTLIIAGGGGGANYGILAASGNAGMAGSPVIAFYRPGGSAGNWDGLGSGGFAIGTAIAGTSSRRPLASIIQPNISTNTWTNIAFVYGNSVANKSTFSSFVNGLSLTTSSVMTGYPVITPGPAFIIGSNFSGSIGQTLIYNRALTYNEVIQNYNATKSIYGL